MLVKEEESSTSGQVYPTEAPVPLEEALLAPMERDVPLPLSLVLSLVLADLTLPAWTPLWPRGECTQWSDTWSLMVRPFASGRERERERVSE